jgi:hypothetical protein
MSAFLEQGVVLQARVYLSVRVHTYQSLKSQMVGSVQSEERIECRVIDTQGNRIGIISCLYVEKSL